VALDHLTFNHGAAILTEPATARATVADGTRPARAQATAADADAGAAPRLEAAPVEADPAFWGVSLFTLLLFVRPQDTVAQLGTLHLAEMAAGLSLAAMLIARLRRGKLPIPFTREIAAVVALGGVMVATAPFSIWPGGAIATVTDVFLKVVLVFVLLCHALATPARLRALAWVLVVSVGYVACRGVVDYARGVNLLEGGRLHGPVGGLVGNPNDLAMTMVTFLPLALLMAISQGRWLARTLAGGIGLAMVATILLTRSRAGLLGLLVAIVFIILLAGRLRLLIATALVAGCLIAVPVVPPEFWQRAASIANPEEDETGSREARKVLMLEAWDTFLERPLTGVGAGQFENYNPPSRLEPWRETHNVVLQILVELGLLGGLVFGYLLWRAVASITRTRRLLARERTGTAPSAFGPEERAWLRTHVVAVTAGFAGWFTCAQFSSAGYYWTFYYLFALIVAGAAVVEHRLVDVRRASPRALAAR
jgi:O-antigen ligase